ncbi:hypothetical protein PsAD2_01050 [Pseudovibrio axinellae]|uniref:Uncharacterized protein n=1 Tax=Pseudovibrio axinellae TaxID=989403 RepID=A0A161XGT4_9HYPH|nr:hypothetical protein PsAD2_01050 [Pseudovibrio axinellae]SEP77101.1 hypothetical protein SAMN05421798_101351 [Pseudovibrio axinellae]
MIFDALRNIGIIVIFAGGIYSFHRIRKQNEYSQLRERGLCPNLNVIHLLPAFFRKKDDPIKRIHTRLSKIGLWHAFLVPFGILGYAYFTAFIEFSLSK